MSLYVCFVLAIRPVRQTFEFDYDEGLNLIKALLYSKGFSLYTQIWSDQPPLLTVILSHWFSLFGYSVFAARLLILLFSALLVWSFYQIIRYSLGMIPALLATLLLLTSWLFVRLSIAVMIGIPTLSLAMFSIYFLTLYKRHRRNIFIILSGGLFALSLQTKLFTVFLIPLILLYLWDFKIIDRKANNNPEGKVSPNPFPTKRRAFNFSLSPISDGGLGLKSVLSKYNVWYSCLLWLGTFLGVYVTVGLLCHSLNYEQLFQAHLGEGVKSGFKEFNNIDYLRYLMIQDLDYIFLALIGTWAIFLNKQREGFLPLAWLATAILLLLNHKPVWDHHYTLLAIPITWLAAYGVAFIVDFFPKGWNSNFKSLKIKKLILPGIATAILIFSMIAIPVKPKGKPPKNMEVMNLVLKYKDSTQWLFTDRPIYAFYAGLSVPPEIAVISEKRFNSGNLTNDDLLTILEKYRPEQIVFARWTEKFKSDEKISAYIKENYSKTYENEKDTVEHYVLKEFSR
ncbi:glycosyltransferase family 39 protein [Funiculus sociatus GB2-M2]|uniref:ArnT family glycosyltransferase n=1 Tax=Cyanophyceae TaxID=3028117 RepID=UPI0018EF5898|nr:glycosyltransferase family 39 protein [Trichocoleus sp. FACHB-90]